VVSAAEFSNLQTAEATGQRYGTLYKYQVVDSGAQLRTTGVKNRSEVQLLLPSPDAAGAASTVRATQGRFGALRAFNRKRISYGAFVWARGVLNGRKWRFPARAVGRFRGVRGDHRDQDDGWHRVLRGDVVRQARPGARRLEAILALPSAPPGAVKRP
jgi:hypothetical protein